MRLRDAALRERPECFDLDPSHPLATGLVFAGLGRLRGTDAFRDSSPYGNHGTLTSMDPGTDWVWVPSLGRWALDFDGSNDYVALPNNMRNADAAGTFAAWIKPTTLAAVREIFSLGIGTADNPYLGMYVDTAGKWTIYEKASNAGVISDTAIAAGTQHHVAVMSNGSAWTLYLDGVAPTMTVYTANNGKWFLSQASAATFYTLGILRRNTNSLPMLGTIGDPLIWNRVLSAAEIASLADPSNVMLSGLLVPTWRRVYAVAAAGGETVVEPDAVSAAWSVGMPTLNKAATPSVASFASAVGTPLLSKAAAMVAAASAWSAGTPTVGKAETTSAASGAWTVGTPTLNKAEVPSAVAAALAANSPTLSKAVLPTAVPAAWSVPAPTTSGGSPVTGGKYLILTAAGKTIVISQA